MKRVLSRRVIFCGLFVNKPGPVPDRCSGRDNSVSVFGQVEGGVFNYAFGVYDGLSLASEANLRPPMEQ